MFLKKQFSTHSRTKIAGAIDAGYVRVDGELQSKPSLKLKPGMVVEIEELPETSAPDLTPADIPIEVCYEDEHLLVVNKPRGLAAHPAASLKEPSLVNALLSCGQKLSTAGGEFRPGIVHRLDKDTTGLMVVAKNDRIHNALAKQFESKTAERRYVAVVDGNVAAERFLIDAPIARDQKNRLKMAVDPKGKPAKTHILRVARLDAGWLVAARLETGRTHQIRVHLTFAHHPVLGDTLYGQKHLNSVPLQLHAAYLALTHPVSKSRLEVYVDPPDDFLGCLSTSREVLDKL
ncbi:MAG: RluA family pseudouridine synthase [Fimbriimonadaceae bacterium]|nr:RluA family pseudouridine synthase [Fimbriimonadaceae bacterium]